MFKLIRSKSPLRLGLAGGGTDVSPYSDLYGGAILNATINLYAQTTIEPLTNGQIIIESIDRKDAEQFAASLSLPINGRNDLVKGIYNRLVRDGFIREPMAFRITTHVDVPVGSGLGTSSSLVISILSAFVQWLRLPLGEYEIAHLAFEIERFDLEMAGGKQDQYAAAFGGVNFMEFYANDKVIVNPLRIKREHLFELENNLVLYFTSTTRLSSTTIENHWEEIRHLRTQLEKKDQCLQTLQDKVADSQRNIDGNRQLINKLLSDLDRMRQDLEWYKRTYEHRSLLGVIKDRIKYFFS